MAEPTTGHIKLSRNSLYGKFGNQEGEPMAEGKSKFIISAGEKELVSVTVTQLLSAMFPITYSQLKPGTVLELTLSTDHGHMTIRETVEDIDQ